MNLPSQCLDMIYRNQRAEMGNEGVKYACTLRKFGHNVSGMLLSFLNMLHVALGEKKSPKSNQTCREGKQIYVHRSMTEKRGHRICKSIF